MNHLEELCRPLILKVCEYYGCARAGAPVDPDQLRQDILQELNECRTKCENDGTLQREFQCVEQPLIFFIDYLIKEGKFPFSASWQPIARSYKELSGDEKFFDLLSETLDDPDSADRLHIFYQLLGLGFDGCCKGESEYVERRMKLCAVRSHLGEKLSAGKLLANGSSGKVPPFLPRRYSRSGRRVFWFCILIVLAAFAWNMWNFIEDTAVFRDRMGKAAHAIINRNVEKAGTVK